jgi:cyclomaltodextrinase / maltogenic alpha-amylase / neopullulanase
MRTLAERGARLVTVRGRPAGAAAEVELRGELPHWGAALPMQAAGDGFEARLRAGPGVYEIKLRTADGAWHVDAGWRTVTRAGEVNGLLVVGGAAEPVVHAPAPPWLARLDDGRLRVRAGLRRGAGPGLRLAHDEGGGERVRPMRPVGEDGDLRLFEVDLPGSGRAVEYAFVAGERTVGDASGAAFRVEPAALPAPPPAWWRDAVLYTVLVDRFRPGGRGGRWPAGTAWDRERRAGGDLDGLVEALPYLVDLGVTALHLTPISVAPSAHRYDAVDPRAVDPALGGDAALDRLLAAAHAAGLRVLLDLAVTHVDRDFAPFADVRARGPASPYWRWFRGHRWPFFDGPDPGYQHYQRGQWREPLLALDEPEVGAYLADTFAGWARRGADGLRLDAAADVPVPLAARLRAAVRAVRPDAVVFGEVVPACADRWVPEALDAATDFALREATIAWLGGAAPGGALAAVASRQRRRGLAGPRGLAFTGTHDQPRVATVTGDAALARLGLVAVALGARVPLLYYGDEVGLAAEPAAAARAFEDSWPDRQPMPWDEAAWDEPTRALVRAALALRRDREVLRLGDEEVLALTDDVICVRRRRGDQLVDVLLHRGAAATTVPLPPAAAARTLWAAGDAALLGDGDGASAPQARLGPRTALVVDRSAPPDAPALRVHNAALAAQAFRDGHVVTPTYPTRLYLTVTEACNLRCQHCITDAPARTGGGTARSLAPWLLDALAEPFAHADYVAFTHGGESLIAPIFPEVLRRIAHARAGRPGRADVHLISNGALLGEERLRGLLDLGLTSLMVSLDGAIAATNDRIRVLGRFDRVVAHLAAAVRLRATRGADLRLGVSIVVGQSNLAELPALGRLCVDLGLDWLKVEETWPATPFARRDLVDPAAPPVADAMAALRDAIAGAPLILVDHLAPPAACACSGEAAAIAFRAADDFANRAAFRPCRAAWEQAAIDPDGTVHLVDYAGPELGSLLDADLLTLWNAAPALRWRERDLAAAPTARRRACTGADLGAVP